MKRKINKNNGIFYVVISLVAVLAIGSGLYAYTASQNVNVNGDYNYYEAERQSEPVIQNQEIGAIPGGDIYQPVTFYNKFGYGEGRNKTEYFYKAISFADNTTTPVIWNSKDDGFNDFYLVDMWLENSGKATSSLRICVSTTTNGTLFGNNDATLLTDDAGACTLIRTLSNAFGADGATYDSNTATSSMFSIRQYPGTDTRIAANKLEGFVINSTTDIFVRVTSTDATYDAGLMGADISNGILHIIGRESKR